MFLQKDTLWILSHLLVELSDAMSLKHLPSDKAQGAQVPGFQRFWLLAAMGGCPVRTKAAAAAAVGAEGVCVCVCGWGKGQANQ